MCKYELVEITVLCMVYDDDKILLQNKVDKVWGGMTFPGGHVEKNESFSDAVIREIKEETGLDIYDLCFCGIEQFINQDGYRYLVLLFKTNKFSGNLISSEEGEMLWLNRSELKKYKLVDNFKEILYIFDNKNINELYYERFDNLFAPKFF